MSKILVTRAMCGDESKPCAACMAGFGRCALQNAVRPATLLAGARRCRAAARRSLMDRTEFTHPLSRADLVEIEHRAHVMRAEAMRGLIRGAGRALRRSLGG